MCNLSKFLPPPPHHHLFHGSISYVILSIISLKMFVYMHLLSFLKNFVFKAINQYFVILSKYLKYMKIFFDYSLIVLTYFISSSATIDNEIFVIVVLYRHIYHIIVHKFQSFMRYLIMSIILISAI